MEVTMDGQYSNMEEMWGMAATHTEHHVQDHIHYMVEGQTRTGTIVWISAPAACPDRPEPTRYVVQPDDGGSLDMVCSRNILVDEGQKQQAHLSAASAESTELEQALIQILSTLSMPIIIKVEIDDEGQPFYVWHIGESTPQQPFGLYVGTDRRLSGTLKLALETLIKHLQREK
jgi:hypothetical protein